MKRTKPSALKPRTIARYMPLVCQVHSCKEPSVAYCLNTYVFVCAKHRQEFCVPDKHRMEDLSYGLQQAIIEAESNVRASLAAAEKYDQDATKYRKHLKNVGLQ